jgi:predicted ArsR family transcriptional regulator
MLHGLGETQRKLMGFLQLKADGSSADALAEQLGVTITAVRQHLLALERNGLVTRGSTRASGGRPQQLYVLTPSARELFPRQYSWFSELLLTKLRQKLGSAGLEQTLHALGADAGASVAAPETASLSERASVLAKRMRELGYDADVQASKSRLDVVARNCVFHKLAAEHPEVCSFDLGLIGAAAGASVEHAECIVRGGSACRFELTQLRLEKARGKR